LRGRKKGEKRVVSAFVNCIWAMGGGKKITVPLALRGNEKKGPAVVVIERGRGGRRKSNRTCVPADESVGEEKRLLPVIAVGERAWGGKKRGKTSVPKGKFYPHPTPGKKGWRRPGKGKKRGGKTIWNGTGVRGKKKDLLLAMGGKKERTGVQNGAFGEGVRVLKRPHVGEGERGLFIAESENDCWCLFASLVGGGAFRL